MTCECARCKRAFTGIKAFDMHHDVDYTRPHGDVVRCLDPATVGLVLDGHGRWARPMNDRDRARLDALHEKETS